MLQSLVSLNMLYRKELAGGSATLYLLLPQYYLNVLAQD